MGVMNQQIDLGGITLYKFVFSGHFANFHPRFTKVLFTSYHFNVIQIPSFFFLSKTYHYNNMFEIYIMSSTYHVNVIQITLSIFH